MLSLLLAATGSQFMAFVTLTSVIISRGLNFPICILGMILEASLLGSWAMKCGVKTAYRGVFRNCRSSEYTAAVPAAV